MGASSRRRGAVFLVPLVIALVASRRVAGDVRTVDFLMILACGAIIGVSLVSLMQALKTRGGMKR